MGWGQIQDPREWPGSEIRFAPLSGHEDAAMRYCRSGKSYTRTGKTLLSENGDDLFLREDL